MVNGFLILMVPTFVVNLLAMAFWVPLRAREKMMDGEFPRSFSTRLKNLKPLTLWEFCGFRFFNLTKKPRKTSLIPDFFTRSTRKKQEVGTLLIFFLGALLVLVPWAASFATSGHMQEATSPTTQGYFQNFLHYFHWNPLHTTSEWSGLYAAILFISWGFLLLLTLTRLCFVRRYPLEQFEHYILVTYLLHAALTALFLTKIRIRLPFDPLLMIICANFIGEVGKNPRQLFR